MNGSKRLITTGVAGTNEIDGTGIGMVPPLLDDEKYDEARAISQPAAFEMTRRLAYEEGLSAGASTGRNVVGAIELAGELGPGSHRRHRRLRHRPEVPRRRSVRHNLAG